MFPFPILLPVRGKAPYWKKTGQHLKGVDMRFEYIEAKTISEAVSLLIKYDGKAKVIAGGTDLMVEMKRKQIRPKYVIDLSFLTGLDYIDYEEKQVLKIGAMTTIRSLERSPIRRQGYSLIYEAAKQLASITVRNRATLGGNLCNASPAADMAPGLIALSASAKIVGPDRERIVLLEDFFTGPGTTVLESGELLVEIQVPVPEPRTGGTYLKHTIRGSMDLAIVGAAAVIRLEPDMETCKDINLSLGAVAPTPIRLRRVEDMMKGKKIHEDLIIDSASLAVEESHPISDVRSSAEYRREMINVFTRKAVRQAFRFAKS